MRYLILIALAVLLAACEPPAVQATFPTGAAERAITVAPSQAVYGVTLSAIPANTTDPRCVVDEDAVACNLGDLSQPTTVEVVTSSPGEMSCTVFAMLTPGDPSSYRPFTCRVQ